MFSRSALRFCLVWLAFAAAPSNAQDSLDEEFFGELPIVLSATRLSQTPVESPSSVTIIDRELIAASGARHIPDLLALVPGFQVGYPRGNRPIATYHGLGDQFARRMQVLVDGRSVYVPLFGGVPWENLPLAIEDIEKIEVVRGPNAASFGPNSFSAIINITTRQAYEESGIRLSGRRGSAGINDGAVSTAGRLGGGAFRLSLSREADDGFEDLRDSRESEELTFRFDRPLGARDSIMLQAATDYGSNGIGEGDQEREFDARYSFLLADWQHNFSATESFNLRLHMNRYTIDDVVTLQDPAAGITSAKIDSNARSERREAEAQWIVEFSDNVRAVFGGSLREDRVRAEGLLNSADWIDNSVQRVFAHGEFRAGPQWIFNAGTMIEENDISGRDDSPRISAIYKFDPQRSLRISRSQATRTPVIFEQNSEIKFLATLEPALFAQLPAFLPGLPADLRERIVADGTLDSGVIVFRDWLGVGGLAPERITSTEIGYHVESADRRLSLDLKLFEDDMRDLLQARNRPDISAEITEYIRLAGDPSYQIDPDEVADSHFNSVDVSIRGLETGIDWRPSGRFRLFGGFSYLEAEGNETDHLNSIPRRIISLLGIFRPTPVHTLSLLAQHQDEFEWVDSNLRAAYTRLDLQFMEHFRWGNNRGNFSLVLQDVLGPREAYFEDLIQGPRGFVRFSLLLP